MSKLPTSERPNLYCAPSPDQETSRQLKFLLQSVGSLSVIIDIGGHIVATNSDETGTEKIKSTDNDCNGHRAFCIDRLTIGENYFNAYRQHIGKNTKRVLHGITNVIQEKQRDFSFYFTDRQNGKDHFLLCRVSCIVPYQASPDNFALIQHIDVSDSVSEIRQSNQILIEQCTALQKSLNFALHEFREPVRAITGFCSELSSDYGALVPEDGQECIEQITYGGKRLNALFDGLSQYINCFSAPGEKSDVDLNSVLAEVCEDLSEAIFTRKAKISIELLPEVSGYQNALHILFRNLVENAIKFHGAQLPKVTIWARTSAGRSTVYVRDNGIGIPASQTESIFKLFRRLHRHEEIPGTGAGLAICMKIVEFHNGTLWVESSGPAGTVFAFSIPHD